MRKNGNFESNMAFSWDNLSEKVDILYKKWLFLSKIGYFE